MASSTDALYEAVERSLDSGERFAVATIVRTRGSSPREVGAKMLVYRGGATDGSVGGGCGEADVWRTALEVIDDGEPRTVVVDLTEDIAMNTDGVCGGILEIFVEPWGGSPAGTGAAPAALPTNGLGHALSRGVLDAISQRRVAVTATVVSQSSGKPAVLGSKLLVIDGEVRAGDLGWPALQRQVLGAAPEVAAGGKSVVRAFTVNPSSTPSDAATGDVSVFFEVALPRPLLVVVGAGHVAVPIAQVGKLLDFEVAVIDDRPSFASAERFPSADHVIVDDFQSALDRIAITPSTYLVLVTRGHVHDVKALRKVIEKPAAYIGMIGSRRRVFAVFKLLRDEGVAVESLLRIHAPIGLDIKTETPGEIAVSVGAEILKVRRGGGAQSFSELLRPQYRYSLTKGALDKQ